MDGTQSAGSSNNFARADHIHPTDTSRASTDAVTQSANGLMTSADKQKIDKSMVVGSANTSGTTSAYTATITGVTLTHGTIIALYNAVGANAASATLNVNSLGAKPIYYNASAIPASRYPNKATCLFMYNTSIVSTGCWQLIYSYDSNTTYSLTTLKDSNAHSNIGTAANASQADINTAVDTKISTLASQEDLDDIVAGDVDLTGYVKDTDSRLSDARTPTSHTHGNLQNDGSVGTSNNASKNVVTDANGKITTEAKPTVPTANSTATNIKMDGTQSAGSLSTFAKADHVHPTDTSRAAASHSHTKSEITDFPTSMTPASHAHGNITNAGAIGSTANLPVITTTSGKLTTGSFGTAANTFCQGNDSRLSDARTPTSHTHGSITNDGKVGTAANKPLITGTNGVVSAGSFEDTATNIKMNGTQSVGSLNTFARGDHVHPVDTSRAPKSHKSTGTDYGVSDASNYGHAMASSTTPTTLGTAAVGSETGKFARGDHVHAHPAYTARTGKPTANQTPAFGGTATVSQITSDATGHVTGATDRTIKIPDTSASTSAKGLVQLDAAPVDASSNAVTSGGLFTALDAKQNAAETQSKIVGFTNKDRIDISRLLTFMDDYEDVISEWVDAQSLPVTHYSLKLVGIYLPAQVQYSKSSLDYNDKLPAENTEGMDLYCIVYENGIKQESTTQSITFKLLDGTVLGTSSTNSGNSTAGYTKIEKAIQLTGISCEDLGVGIHYMYAEATIDGSVVRSNILSVFVKDTNNLFGYDYWTGTEYINHPQASSSWGVNLITSNKWSNIGESSLQIIPTSTDNGIRIRYWGALLNKTVTAKLYVYTKQTVTIRLRELTSSNTIVKQSSVNFTGCGEVTLSLDSGDNNASFYIQISGATIVDEPIFIDNIRLTSS